MSNAMSTILYVARAVKHNELDLQGAVSVDVSSTDIQTYGEDGKYIDWLEVEADRLGYDTYSFCLEDAEFTIEELQAYIDGPFEEELRVYNTERQAAVERIAFLSVGIGSVMEEILKLASKYDIPADIKIGKRTNDFRLIDAVDWNSSSMYC